MSLLLRSSQGTTDTCDPPVVYWRPFTLPLRDLGPRQGNLVLERLCSNCNGAAYVPVVISQMCNACAGSGRELLEDQEVACSNVSDQPLQVTGGTKQSLRPLPEQLLGMLQVALCLVDLPPRGHPLVMLAF